MKYLSTALGFLLNPLSTGFLLFGAVTGILVFEDTKLRIWFPLFYKPFPKAFSAVLLVNVLLSALILIFLGGGKFASNRYKAEKVTSKDGDREWDGMSLFRRFFIPKDSSAKTHDHLQLLAIRDDIYVLFLVLSLIGGLRYPFAVTVAGFLWCISYIHLKWGATISSKEMKKPKFEGLATKALSTGLLIPFLSTFAFSIYLSGYVKDTDTIRVVENWQKVGRWNR